MTSSLSNVIPSRVVPHSWPCDGGAWELGCTDGWLWRIYAFKKDLGFASQHQTSEKIGTQKGDKGDRGSSCNGCWDLGFCE